MSHVATKNNKNGKTVSPTHSRDVSESTTTTAAPDGGWGWMVVFASFMIHIITDGMTYSFGVFYNEFLEVFDESKSLTAWIVSILCGVTLISGPISSSFVNRWGCQAVTVAGALLASACVIISAYAQNVMTLIVTIGVGTGFGFGLIYLPAIVSVTVWFERYRSLATGIAVCGSGLGTFLFAPITAFLIKTFGWRGAMGIIGAFILNCIPLGIMFKPVPEAQQTNTTEQLLPRSQKGPLKRSQSTEYVTKMNGYADDDVARLTLSQPALNKNENNHRHHSRNGSGIMLRPDVLYQGSLQSLAKSRASSPERHLNHSTHNHVKKDDTHLCGWLRCSAESKAALSQMLDISLLVDPVFLLFTLSNFLTSIGFYIPYIYTVPMSNKLGIENSEYLLSIIGVSNMVGRIILGYISDKPWVNRLLAYSMCLTIAGISTALATFAWEFYGFALYAIAFGFTIGAYVGLTSVVLVDLLGLERLTNAFGLLLLFQGIASLVGPPFAGWLYDLLLSYNPGFYVAGGTIAMSGIILFFIPALQRRAQNNVWNKDDVTLEEM